MSSFASGLLYSDVETADVAEGAPRMKLSTSVRTIRSISSSSLIERSNFLYLYPHEAGGLTSSEE